MTDHDRFLVTQEAAERLRLSPRSLERFRLNGMGPCFVKAGRRVLYRISDLDAWANARTYASTAEAEAARTA